MARISDVTVKEQPEYHALTIRRTICFMSEFSDFADACFGKILHYLERLGALVSDGPIVCFHNMDLERLDVEVGFPVARAVEGNEEILAIRVPAQKVVTAIDQGAYEEQDPTLADLFSCIQEQGYEPLGDIWYQYLNDTNRPADQYLTKMAVPIR